MIQKEHDKDAERLHDRYQVNTAIRREIEAHVARGFRQKNSIALSPEASDRCSSSLWIEVYLTNLIDVIADSVRLVNISFACISKDNLARVAALWFGDFKDLICSCCNAKPKQGQNVCENLSFKVF